MKKSVFAFIFVVFCVNMFSTGFIKSYEYTSTCVFNSFTLLEDGGFIATGYCGQQGSNPTTLADEQMMDIVVARLESSGEIVWQYSYGGSDNDLGYGVIPTSDGGFLVAGETKSLGAQATDAIIFKVNGSGVILWARIFGGAKDDWAVDAKEDDNGNYLILGVTTASTSAQGRGEDETTTNYDIFLLGLTKDGFVNFEKTYDGGDDDSAYQLFKDKEGEFLIAGTSKSKSEQNYNGIVVKIDGAGIIKWQKYYGNLSDNYAYSITEGKDGGYLLVGETYINAEQSKGWVVKIDSFGGDTWQKSYGYSPKEYSTSEFIQSAKPFGAHGFLLCGGSISSTNEYHSFALKIDWSGKIIWKKEYKINGKELLYQAKPTKDKGIVMLGVSASSSSLGSFIAKTNKKGEIDSCSTIEDSPIKIVKLSSGSGNLKFTTTSSSLTITIVDVSFQKSESGIEANSVCE